MRRSSTLLLEGAGPWQRRATYGRKRHLRRTPMTEAEAHQPGTTRMSAKARVTKGLLQGVTITGFGLGGAFSNLVAGFIAQRFGFPIGFLSLAATAAVAFALFLSRCRRPRARAATQNRRRRQHSSAARRVGAFQAKPSAGCRRSPVPLSLVSSRRWQVRSRDRPARRTARKRPSASRRFRDLTGDIVSTASRPLGEPHGLPTKACRSSRQRWPPSAQYF